jgi:FtsP/CotA-like multicopper oxidase with cupredoxin domain
MNRSRRDFLKIALGVAAGACLPALSGPKPLAAANQRVKEFRISASPTRINLGVGPEFTAWCYNGQAPGPEIRVQEGDLVRVVLKNYLPEATTVHWHGIPVANAMDGVPGVTQTAVRTGETFVYEFEAKPAGTFLYHSHARYQLDQGLYGPLIIEPTGSHESCDREYVLVLEDWVMRDGGGPAALDRRPAMGMGMMGRMMRGRGSGREPLWEPVYDGYAVNGRVYPAVKALQVRQGDKVKLRLINASSATIFYLRLAGHTMTVTHCDGNAVVPIETDVLRIAMGERYDVMLTATNPGHWLLAASEQGLGESGLRVPLIYQGSSQARAVAPDFQPGLRLATYGDLRALEPHGGFNGDPDRVYDQTLSGGMHSAYWTINGRAYPDADRLRIRRGERVRLRYWNRSMMPHPMHLHGHFFQLVNPMLTPDQWAFKDTLVVDPMQTYEIEFLADNPGNWLHHCHNLYHMEAGMANVVAYV